MASLHRRVLLSAAMAATRFATEGHTLEALWFTGLSVNGIYAEPIDLELPEEQLREELGGLAVRLKSAQTDDAPPST